MVSSPQTGEFLASFFMRILKQATGWLGATEEVIPGQFKNQYMLRSDEVQTKMSPTISFSVMYQKLFVYHSNMTNYQ